MQAHEGWAVVEPARGGCANISAMRAIRGRPTAGHAPSVVTADDSGVHHIALPGNMSDYARQQTGSTAYPGLGSQEAAARREKDGLAAQVAAALKADIFITERPYLFEISPGSTLGVTICNPRDALALVALYLRAQSEFLVWRDPVGTSFSMNHDLYFWVGARELLPAAWRWHAACVQKSANGGDPGMQPLAEALLRRTQRGLQSRDAFHIAFNQPQNSDSSRDVLAQLDSMLVLLMSAVDVSARVAHLVLGLTSGIYYAGWQRRPWLIEVRIADAALAALFDNATNNWHALTILRLLRNTVHGRAIREIRVRLSGGAIQTQIQLPPDNEADILASMDVLGGRSSWGCSTSSTGIQVNPAIFVERLWPEILRVLNETMVATPMERLANVSLTPAGHLPPPDSTSGVPGVFDEPNRLSIRWQLGF